MDRKFKQERVMRSFWTEGRGLASLSTQEMMLPPRRCQNIPGMYSQPCKPAARHSDLAKMRECILPRDIVYAIQSSLSLLYRKTNALDKGNTSKKKSERLLEINRGPILSLLSRV